MSTGSENSTIARTITADGGDVSHLSPGRRRVVQVASASSRSG